MFSSAVLFVIFFVADTDAYCSRYWSFPWQPHWMPIRDDLYCDNVCEEYHNINQIGFSYKNDPNATALDKCCTCHSCTDWKDQETDLFIEYISVTGKSMVLSDEVFNNSTDYKIEHTDQVMTEIPSNICDWDKDGRILNIYPQDMFDISEFWNNIMTIDLSGNGIKKIVDLNCLQRLDTIQLKNNKIAYITNTSISNLKYLRNLDLSGNEISGMDAGVLFSPNMNIFFANLAQNNLPYVDVTNVFLPNPFCRIDYSYNKITKLVNNLGIKLDHTKKYGPGMVRLASNLMEVFPDLETLFGLTDLSEWGQLFSFGFDLRNVQLNCNCNLEPFVDLAEGIRDTLWRDYFNVTCVTPPELKGQTAFFIDPIKFVCPIDGESNCPKGCTCIDQPRTNTLFVDCSNINLNELPNVLPSSEFTKYISLNVSNNHITKLPNLYYLDKLNSLDISGNILEEISDTVARNLENTTLDISNNIRLRKLPQTFQFRNICVTNMAQDVIDCNCDTLWMETWMQTKYDKTCRNKKQLFKCFLQEKGEILASDFHRSLLTCKPENYILYVILFTIAGLLIFMVLSGTIIFIFRYELLVLWLCARQTSLTVPVAGFQHDVIISLIKEDDDLRKWVTQKLYKSLINDGYKVCLPVLDIVSGAQDNEMALAMKSTRSLLLILSDSYLEKPDNLSDGRCPTENEWKYGWHQYKQDKNKNIVIVNYDHISSFDVDHKQIKAYLRVGHTVQFGNHDNEVIDEIKKKIGPPSKQVEFQTRRGENNNKTVFNRNQVFPSAQLLQSKIETEDLTLSSRNVGGETNPKHKAYAKELHEISQTDSNLNKDTVSTKSNTSSDNNTNPNRSGKVAPSNLVPRPNSSKSGKDIELMFLGETLCIITGGEIVALGAEISP